MEELRMGRIFFLLLTLKRRSSGQLTTCLNALKLYLGPGFDTQGFNLDLNVTSLYQQKLKSNYCQ